MSFTADLNRIVDENRNRLLGIAPSWSRVRLKEVASIQNGFPFESSRFSKSDGTPLVRIRDVLSGDTETYYQGEFDPEFLVRDGDLLVGMDGDFHCAPWGGGPALLNQRVCRITADENRYSRNFLRYVLPGYLNAINDATPSVTVKHLSSRTVADIPLPCPPLSVQRRIVAEIEKQFTRLDAGIAALRNVQAKLRRYRAAVLKAACEGRLVQTEAEIAKKVRRNFESGEDLLEKILAKRRTRLGNAKYKEPQSIDRTASAPLPEGWTWSTLDQLHWLLRNGISVKPNGEFGLPILRISAVRALRLHLEEIRYLKGEESDYCDYALDCGDLLFTRYNGNAELVGVCAIVPPLSFTIVYPDKLIRCKVATDVDPKFVAIMANVGVSRSHLSKRIRTTAGQAGISGGDLKGLPIPLPPLAEQRRIVAEVERRLSVVDELEAVVSANLQRAARLRQSILQKAFAGQLVS